MHLKVKRAFNRHFEWVAFTGALAAMALLNPYADSGSSLCFFEWMGISFCPGEGLGHSIAYFTRGEVYNALQANIMGPAAFIILSGRIVFLIGRIFLNQPTLKEENHGAND